MTAPSDGWVIDCGHWHCVDRYDNRHGHTIAPTDCDDCAEAPTVSEAARALEARALRIAATKHPRIHQTDGDTQ